MACRHGEPDEYMEGDDSNAHREEIEHCRAMSHYWNWVNEVRDEVRLSKKDIAEIKDVLIHKGLLKDELGIVLGHLYGKTREDIIASTEISRDNFANSLHSAANKVFTEIISHESK